jgi:hypothetical protein
VHETIINTEGGAYFAGKVSVNHGSKIVNRDDNSINIEADVVITTSLL